MSDIKDTLVRLANKYSFVRSPLVFFDSMWQRLVMTSYKDKGVMKLISKTRREQGALMLSSEAYLVYSLTRTQKELDGDMAEVGVFRGASAKLICEAKGDRKLHLFDTFEGLPEPQKYERKVFRKNDFKCTLESVKGYLKNYNGVHYYKGFFPETAAALVNTRFSFVHFDADLYQSTLESLKFFYPRMLRGGIILSHDYNISVGVRKAFDEFFVDKEDRVYEIGVNQCMVIKL